MNTGHYEDFKAHGPVGYAALEKTEGKWRGGQSTSTYLYFLLWILFYLKVWLIENDFSEPLEHYGLFFGFKAIFSPIHIYPECMSICFYMVFF